MVMQIGQNSTFFAPHNYFAFPRAPQNAVQLRLTKASNICLVASIRIAKFAKKLPQFNKYGTQLPINHTSIAPPLTMPTLVLV